MTAQDTAALVAELRERLEKRRASLEHEVKRGWSDSFGEAASFATLTISFNGLVALFDAITAKDSELAEARADKERLDFLDACNAALNARYGTNYGWSLVLTHNVTRLMLGRNMEVDLHDSEGGNSKLPSCRGAIDREKSRIEIERRARTALAARDEGGGHG